MVGQIVQDGGNRLSEQTYLEFTNHLTQVRQLVEGTEELIESMEVSLKEMMVTN